MNNASIIIKNAGAIPQRGNSPTLYLGGDKLFS